MPGYSRYSYGRRYWGGYGGKYYSGRRGSTYRKAIGSAKAAKAGNKIAYYNGQVTGYVTFSFTTGSFISNVQMFGPYVGGYTMTGSGSSAQYTQTDNAAVAHGGVMNDKSFRLMCAQYDECRLIRSSVKLMPASSIPNNMAVKVFSIIDRNFTHQEYLDQFSSAMTDQEKIDAHTIMNNQGVVVQTFNGNRISSLNRYCVPTDAKEKQSWMDATVTYSPTPDISPLTYMFNEDWIKNKSTFAPWFQYCLQTSQAAAADTTIVFGYTCEYSFAFRNPRSGIDRFIFIETKGYVNPNPNRLREPEKSDTSEKTETEKSNTTETPTN